MFFVLFYFKEMNAKGVILDAFEQIRLKTCIDFRPKTWFEPHISMQWGIGYALVHGNLQVYIKYRWPRHTACDILLIFHFAVARPLWEDRPQVNRLCSLALSVTPGQLWNMNFFMPLGSGMSNPDTIETIMSQSTGETLKLVGISSPKTGSSDPQLWLVESCSIPL